jgi:hypothetical protein
VRWIQGTAEDIPTLGIGPCRVVTFGQSFHRVASWKLPKPSTTSSSRAVHWF